MGNDGTIQQDAVTQNSSTDNRGASFHNVETVNTGPIIHNTIQQVDRTKHHIPMKDNSLFEGYAKLVLSLMGDSRTALLGAVLLLGGIGTGASPFYIDAIPSNAVSPVFLVGIGVGVVGASFLLALQYKRDSTCPKCETEYGMREVPGATAREVESSTGPMKEITRPYECSHCGHREVETYTVDIEPED